MRLIPKQCEAPQCRNSSVVGSRFCSDHRQEKPKKDYSNVKHKRLQFYGTARWQRFRLATLKENPICVECNRNASQEVHHIKKAKHFPLLRFEPSNCQALCVECHKEKTREERRESI